MFRTYYLGPSQGQGGMDMASTHSKPDIRDQITGTAITLFLVPGGNSHSDFQSFRRHLSNWSDMAEN